MTSEQQEIEEAYEGWEHLLKEKLENLELFLIQVKGDLSNAGMNLVQGDEFLEGKIQEIRREIKSSMVKKRRRVQ